MATFYYHYTSRQAAQDISCVGKIDSPHGINYFTPDFYESGVAAAQALAISNKPVEVAFVIPNSIIETAIGGSAPGTTTVGPLQHPVTGDTIRFGGGEEFSITASVDLNPIQCINLVSP